jgi:uncharacterized membrane protein YcaP (DUF421 family)
LDFSGRRFERTKGGVLMLPGNSGQFGEKNLSWANISNAALLSNRRPKGVFHLDEARCAVPESSGELSVLKEEAQRATEPSH